MICEPGGCRRGISSTACGQAVIERATRDEQAVGEGTGEQVKRQFQVEVRVGITGLDPPAHDRGQRRASPRRKRVADASSQLRVAADCLDQRGH